MSTVCVPIALSSRSSFWPPFYIYQRMLVVRSSSIRTASDRVISGGFIGSFGSAWKIKNAKGARIELCLWRSASAFWLLKHAENSPQDSDVGRASSLHSAI